MKIPKQLKLIGYWNDKLQDGCLLFDGRSSVEYAPYPSPMDLVSPGWLGQEKSKLISYLRSGIEQAQYCGFSTCRFLCENPHVGSKELTDGVWVWPEGLAHYVEVHDVFLPDEFIEHARNNSYQIPEDTFGIIKQPRIIPKKIYWIFHRITRGRLCWYTRWRRKGHDKSFWIEWAKNITKKI